jgi:hypothetical protein
MKGIVREVSGGRVVIETDSGDVLHFEPDDGGIFQPLDLVHWANGTEVYNWTQNRRVRGRWVPNRN